MEEKFAGRIILKDEDSQEVVITVGTEVETNEIYFSTDSEHGDYYLVLKKDDLKKMLE